MASVALLVPHALSLNRVSQSLDVKEGVSVALPSAENPQSAAVQGLRPVPANRLNLAKRSINEKRNPFLVNSFVRTDGNAQLSSATIAAGLNSVRLTGIVQEGSSLKALVEDGSGHDALVLGDHLALGTLKGLGFRVAAISFDQGSISISNGRVEHQIFIPQ